MASTILLDTGILIRHLRNQQTIVRFLRNLSKSDHIAVSAVTRTEILAGTKNQNRIETRRFMSRFITLPVTIEIADRAGETISFLRQNGKSLEVPDALIAATALTQDIQLATLNLKHFELVPNLRLYPLEPTVAEE